MNPSSVQHTGADFPWRGAAPLLYPVEVGRETAVIAVAVFSLDVAMRLQIGKGPLDRAFGESEIDRDGLDPRPAFSLGGGHAFEIHIDRFGPVRQAVVGVDRVKIADLTTSYVLTCEAGVSAAVPASSPFLAPLIALGGYFV